MSFYLPIAEMNINILLIIFIGMVVGGLSGLFGVGGGFLMTPLLIFLGIPPAVAVGTEAPHVLASSVSGVVAHWRRKNVDFKMGFFLLIGGVIGAQYGSKYTSKFKGEQIRVFLAVIVIIVCVKMGLELISEPPMNSRVIIQDAF